MENNITKLHQNNPEENLLSEISLDRILQEGARKLLQAAIESEIDEYIEKYKSLRNSEGNQLVTRNGHMPEREIQT
jgi:hypothetical protein